MARKLTIKWAPGESIAGLLAMPPRPRSVGVLLAHGAGAGQRHPFMEHIRTGLAAAGYPTMSFDYSYMDAGRRAPDRMVKLLAVHRAAADRLAAYGLDVVVAGKSMGGRVGSHLVGDEEWQARGVVYYGYPLVPLGKTEPRSTDQLHRIVCPQLFFAGSRDQLSPPAALRPLVASLALARLHEIDDGDHSFNMPKRAGRTTTQVLDELVAATTSWMEALP